MALRMLAAPPQRGQTHAAPWTNQLVARPAEEVDLVSYGKHPSQSASMSGAVGSGTGSCGNMTVLGLQLLG